MGHKLTNVQRRVLNWMRASEFTVRIETGFKKTHLRIADTGESIIRCQVPVRYFLSRHGYIEQTGGIQAWELTPKGEAAIAKAKGRT